MDFQEKKVNEKSSLARKKITKNPIFTILTLFIIRWDIKTPI